MQQHFAQFDPFRRKGGNQPLAGCAGGCTELAGGEPVTLTLKEFELLRFLMENRGIVFSRDKLLETVWGYNYDGGTRTVDVHVQTLRQELGEYGSAIKTVRGVGYSIGE